MNIALAKKEISRLSRDIEEHNYRYYVLNDPTISDKEYDDLLKQLIRMEEEFPSLKEDQSPSQRVGAKVAAGADSLRHKIKMLSLDNTYSFEELKEWGQRVRKGVGQEQIEYVVEYKIDGVSASLQYEKGNLTVGATRGDGVAGEDITHNVKTIRAIPLRLRKPRDTKIPAFFEVRGEIFMSRRDFDVLNQKRLREEQEPFVNPRNAAAGSVKQLDSRITAQRNLRFTGHSFGSVEGLPALKTHWEFLTLMKGWGLPVAADSRRCQSLEEVITVCQEFQERRHELNFEVDGVVVKVNGFDQQSRLGTTMKSPRWAVAYKFPAQQATTEVRAICFQVGRTGVLTPVAELEPVFCGGVTISRATLHNFDEVKRLGLAINDTVLIERAGDVIPKIIKVVKLSSHSNRKAVGVPKFCPSCGKPIIKDKSDLVAYRCLNPLCPKQLERLVLHFASRRAMDIEGLGESVVTQMVDQKMITDVADLYRLSKGDLLKLDLFAEKKAVKLIAAIGKSKHQNLSRLIYGLGIANVGEKAAATLAGYFGDLANLMQAKADELQQIDDVGPIMADSIRQYFAQASTKKLIKELDTAGVNLFEAQTKKASAKLSNKKFVFTGELPTLSRTEAADLVTGHGGNVVSNVSTKTDYVVVGDAPGSKYKKAKKLGVKIINEDEFKEMIDG